ncbi:MAG TPA: electron transfer flavoprotein subunit alpha/FixB family protein [Streptosporangiaceae bacterium]|nr:electron transfer flavoprotein subunit alpha/FixB family protein [Streptosporangiaceae bacterium]
MTVLCLVEVVDGAIRDASKRALAFARALAESAGEDVTAAWFGSAGSVGLAELGAAGVGVGHAILLGDDVGYAPVAWARALADLADEESVSAVIAAATDRGNEVLAHLAAITDVPMAANCVSATWSGVGQVDLVRQRWAGSLLEEAGLDSPLPLLTVAADAVALPEAGLAGTAGVEPVVRTYEPVLAEGDLLVQATESVDRKSGVSLATARVVVGGGRGVGGPEGFAVLEELADLLGGALGVSRVVTSQGWRPHRQQVGQTGTKITPELYLACGISGAIQHMAGCQGAKTIVAINTDPDAPIIAKANYAVIGDLHQILPALIAALKAANHPG